VVVPHAVELDEHLAVPFEAVVLGVSVTVEKLDLRDDLQIVRRAVRERIGGVSQGPSTLGSAMTYDDDTASEARR